MARRGRFGRRPNGGGGNLAALIASLIREQRAAQDRAIFDAYNNGGMFEGKPVTDSRLLDYIQTRRDQFSADDPLWDQWNNSFIQQRFTIGEQKIGLAYKQGKVKAGAVAAFYRGQLASIPKDSAFYREVASRAAEWSKAARQSSGGGGGGGGSGGGGQSAYKAYQQAGDALEAQKAANLYIDYAIRDALAREGYALDPRQSVLSVGADIITEMFNGGKVVGPNGTIALSDWQQTAANLDTAYATAIDATRKAGYQYAHLIDDRHDFQSDTLTKLPSLPYQVRAEAIYSLLNDNLKAANGDPSLVAKAYMQALSLAKGLSDAATKAGADAEVVSALKNDVLALSGGTPKGDSMLDIIMDQNAATGQARWAFLEPEQGVSSASAQVSADITTNTDAQKLVASGKGYLVQDAETGALATVDAAIQPQGSLGQDYQATLVTINGTPTQVYLHGTQVLASLDENGNPLDPRTVPAGSARPNYLLGYQFTYNLGGKTITAWAVRDAETGALTFTKSNPFLGNATDAGGAIVVNPADLGGEIIDPTAYISQTTLAAEGSSGLVIDPAAQAAIASNPERAYELYRLGKMDADTLVSNLAPSATPGTTPEQALAQAQQYKSNLGSLAKGIIETAASRFAQATTQSQAVATTIFSNLLPQPQLRGQPYWTNYGPPSVNVAPPIQWTPARIAGQQAAFAVRDREVAPLPAPPPPPPPAPAVKPPTSGGIVYTGIPYTPPKPKKAPATTQVTTGRYTGKTVPL